MLTHPPNLIVFRFLVLLLSDRQVCGLAHTHIHTYIHTYIHTHIHFCQDILLDMAVQNIYTTCESVRFDFWSDYKAYATLRSAKAKNLKQSHNWLEISAKDSRIFPCEFRALTFPESLNCWILPSPSHYRVLNYQATEATGRHLCPQQ